jgi:predicted RNA binding protein YcfA (HicA-like mRNA interferase family)
MPKNIPSLKPREPIRLLEKGGCSFYREAKGDHTIYLRTLESQKRVVPIDMGARELSPPYVSTSSDNSVSRMMRSNAF